MDSAATNVRVVCRFRPLNDRECSLGAQCASFPAERTVVVRGEGGEAGAHTFTFDHVFPPETGQEEVFECAARPVVDSVMEGYNGTVFAYGQTSAGKTHTMEGPSLTDPDSMGIVPRMVAHLFDAVERADECVEFTVRVSMLEIYMERIRDLLDASKDNLKIHEDKVHAPRPRAPEPG